MYFLDSSFLISLLIESDKRHQKSQELWELHGYKVINNMALAETLNSINKGYSHASMDTIYNMLYNSLGIVYTYEKNFLEAVKINEYYNNSINFFDCLIWSTMKYEKISKTVSYDNDFDKIKNTTRIYLE